MDQLTPPDNRFDIVARSRFSAKAITVMIVTVVISFLIIRFLPHDQLRTRREVDHVSAIEVSPTGDLVAFACYRKYDLHSNSMVFIADSMQKELPRQVADISEPVVRLAWSADETLIAFGTYLGGVSVWQVNPPRQVWTARISEEKIWGIAFAGPKVIAISGSGCEPGCEGAFTALDAQTGEIVSVDDSFKDTPTTLAVSPGGDRAYLGANYGHSITERDLSTGKVLDETSWGSIYHLSISDNGELLAASGCRKIAVFDREGLKLLCDYRKIDEEFECFHGVRFIPERNELVTFSEKFAPAKCTVQRWSFEGGELRLAQNYGELSPVYAISKDGTRLFHAVNKGFATINLREDRVTQ